MQIRLDLKKHCIATEVKRVYNRTLSSCFKGEGEALEETIETLKYALETIDFPLMRRNYPELAGNSDARVILEAVGGGLPVITINGTAVTTAVRDDRKQTHRQHPLF